MVLIEEACSEKVDEKVDVVMLKEEEVCKRGDPGGIYTHNAVIQRLINDSQLAKLVSYVVIELGVE